MASRPGSTRGQGDSTPLVSVTNMSTWFPRASRGCTNNFSNECVASFCESVPPSLQPPAWAVSRLRPPNRYASPRTRKATRPLLGSEVDALVLVWRLTPLSATSLRVRSTRLTEALAKDVKWRVAEPAVSKGEGRHRGPQTPSAVFGKMPSSAAGPGV
eukprot:scaffold23462_cov66-Phaeocystis_antarctica.AAC.5